MNRSYVAPGELKYDLLLNEILLTVKDAIVTINQENSIVLCSQHAARLFGYAVTELLGQPLELLIAPTYKKEFNSYLNQFRVSRIRSTEVDIYVCGKDGRSEFTRFLVEVSRSNFYGGNQYLSLVFKSGDTETADETGTASPATMLVADLPAGIGTTATDLAATAVQATTVLNSDKAQKMLALGELSSGIVHDFNNYLASIIGYNGLALDIIDDTEKDAVLKSYLQEVAYSSSRANDLVQHLMGFLRGEECVADQATESVSVGSVADQTVEMLRALSAKTIVFVKDIQQPMPPVRIGKVQLSQVLLNLCINARDAISDRGRITVSACYQESGSPPVCTVCGGRLAGPYVQIQVKDNGHGIQQEDIKKIFTRYYTTKETSKGTGLGLAIVDELLHAHDGHVHVASAPGRGSVFTLLFPAIRRSST